ncbi:MAG TPA: hypothetical protein P5513_08515 [Candidatus Diapherotrites archaeon]|nr:hypothetical protein [Candidatus Diapherotrites archaeon]
MKTSNFKNYKGDRGVAICIYPPIDWTGERFPALCPDRDTFFSKKMNNISEEEYDKQYRERVLSKLDPHKIYSILKDRVLLCWEDPEFDKDGNIINSGSGFCHRHIVSKWILENLGIEVKEWRPGDDDTNYIQISLF